MPRTIRNQFDKKLTYEKLMQAHNLSKRGKDYRNEIILFNLKQEEYINWLYENLKNERYKHGGYTVFYVTQPKLRRIEKSRYIDRIVHRWIVDNFLKEYFEKTFISTSYACIKNKGMHKACKDVQKANNTNNRANRGGNYNNNGSNNPASNRNNNNPTNTNSNNGSRPTLIQFLDYIF